MKRLLFALVFGLSGFAAAGDLQDADKFLAAKAYDKALPLYAKLAEAGNIEAQFRLGEMYWYGDGTATDLKAATSWMQKAAARGHAGALESLAILKQREARAADIAYWTSGYKGEDLASGSVKCTAPVIPELSRTNEEIRKTMSDYVAWQECYNGFVAQMNSVPPGKRLPADVVALLTPKEAERAVAHVSNIMEKTAGQAQQEASGIVARHEQWQRATEQHVIAANKARKFDYEIAMQRKNERDSAREIQYPTMNPQPVAPPPAPGR